MRGFRKWSAVALVVAVAACGDSTGPSGNLTTQQKQALINALSSTEFGGLAAIVIQQVGAVGSLQASSSASAQISKAINKALSMAVSGSAATTYEGAVGIAVEFNELYQGETFQGWFYGVVGWNGINVSAGTVNELVLVGGVGDTGSLPGSASGTVESGDVFAVYENAGTIYNGTSGTAAATGSFTGNSTDCSASGQGYSYDCSVTVGTMNANFDFNAINDNEQTYAQSGVQGSALPSVKMSLDITYSSPPPAARRFGLR
jgi:hypothetical protein